MERILDDAFGDCQSIEHHIRVVLLYDKISLGVNFKREDATDLDVEIFLLKKARDGLEQRKKKKKMDRISIVGLAK